MKYDVIVIGLGSAGLMIADRLNDSGLKVLVLEQNRRAGIKLLLTGNGRCNVMSSENVLSPTVECGFFVLESFYF